MKRHRLGLALLALGAVFLLASCVPESRHPLVEPDRAAADPRLAGLWVAKQENQVLYAHFLPRRDRPMDVVLVSEQNDGGGGYGVLSLTPSRIGDERYLSARFLVDDGRVVADDEATYHLLRYRISDDGALTVWAMSEEAVVEDIRQGRIEGEPKAGRWTDSALLTADTDALVAYVGAADPTRVFNALFATFRRLE